ncbi:MAG: RPA12/RPB9/RPC11 RNA polymerase family protein [Candidatus Bathyarchaeota archaeon]|nr:MAG: RPA12/RPB9/RPC11 RNA polymerase family protein [Candidatus Bathyarchaeota archaeon]
MNFCPSCGMRLTPLKKKERRKVALLLSCPKCGYEKRATRPMTTAPKIIERSPQERIAVIGKREKKLRTSPTVRIECPRCENKLAYAWMVQIGSLEESSTQFFRCTKCNYTFREKS